MKRDGDYVVSEGFVAKLERGGWLSWIGMVTAYVVREGWVRDEWLSWKGMGG